MYGITFRTMMPGLVVIGLSLCPAVASAQGYAVVGYQPIVVPVAPVVVAPVYYAPAPAVVGPAPIIQNSYYAPVPTPVVTQYAPAPVGGIVRERVNYGLFGQLNHHVKGYDPCIGPYHQHTRVGWNGYSYRLRTW